MSERDRGRPAPDDVRRLMHDLSPPAIARQLHRPVAEIRRIIADHELYCFGRMAAVALQSFAGSLGAAPTKPRRVGRR
jgi:hypothetical protein